MRIARLVVFDLDGTLVDSRKDLADAVNALLAELGRPSLPEATVGDMVGEGARVLIDRALAASGVEPALAPAALQRFLALYDARLLDHTGPYDGIPELLRALHGRVRLAVLTNKPAAAAVRILQGLKLAPFFDEVIGGDSPLPRKPDPAALLHLMDRFGAAPNETTLVGDSRIDLETARSAGVRACLVRYGFGFRFEEAELRGVAVAGSPREIAGIITAEARKAPNSL
jgi:phosphoglycolate phosphatase